MQSIVRDSEESDSDDEFFDCQGELFLLCCYFLFGPHGLSLPYVCYFCISEPLVGFA